MTDIIELTQNKRDAIDSTVCNSNSVCRGCLKKGGEMKNLFEKGLDDDFFAYTGIIRDPPEGMPQLICDRCEANLQIAKKFKNKCQKSDMILRSNLKKKALTSSTVSQVRVTSVLRNKSLIYLITAPNPEDKISLKCPHKLCNSEFYKKIHVINHLRKVHNISNEFVIYQKFYCTEKNCVYSLNSADSSKFFTGRKFLNQHYSKMHNDKVYACESCDKKFPKVTDYHRHLKSCNIKYVCSSCKSSYNSHESYLVHLLRKHPDQHAKYKQEKKAKKRLTEKSEKGIDVTNQLPTKIRKDNLVEETQNDIVKKVKPSKLEESNFLPHTESNIASFQPLDLNIDVFETSITPLQYIAEIESDETPYVAQEYTIQENICGESIAESFAENLTVAEVYTIKEETNNKKVTPEYKKRNSNQIGEESWKPKYRPISKRSNSVDVSNEMESLKKSSATQMPEDITNDMSLTAWSNKNDYELQNESTQTVFEDMLAMRSQNSDEEIYFSESVSLSDIHTQTNPFEFGSIRSNKETQSCTSQTKSPDLSIKETQTCLSFLDLPNFNIGSFVDSLPSNSASGNFISTETQTADFRTAVRSDVLLSFSSAETQTCFEEASDKTM